MLNNNKNIAIITCCIDDWGGSEELWARAIPYMQKEGYQFTVLKEQINFNHPEIQQLSSKGVCFKETKEKNTLKKWSKKISYRLKQGSYPPIPCPYVSNFVSQLTSLAPAFVIIAQGINFDGLGYAYQCMQLNIPYCIIAQKAVDFYWPPPHQRKYMVEVLKKSVMNYFVSNQNKRLTEEQFGLNLLNSEVVWNPIKVNRNPIPYPTVDEGFQLACVGRLFVIDKGQDILLRILAKESWRSRPITVSFIGVGIDERGLQEMADLLDVPNIKFVGSCKNIAEIWEKSHALILPSRSEGMALSVLEAMAAGRVVIVTNAGGHTEIIRHTINGFIGDATEKDFEKTMEDAWNMRQDWPRIGKNANFTINELVPEQPEKKFSQSVLKLLNEL